MELFGRLQTDCGYTPDQIREMTLPDIGRLMKHWSKYPPLRDLVAMAIEFEIPTDKPEENPKYMTADDFKRLMAVTAGRVPGMT